MLSRKFAVIAVLVALLVGAVPVFAQVQVPPEATPSAAQGNRVSVIVGADLLQRAGQAFEAGDFEKAVRDYSLLILLNPTFSQAYYLRGLAYSRLNDLDHALDDLNTALSFPQPSPEIIGLIYNDRALLHMMREDSEAALDDLDAAVEVAPDLPEVYARRAQIHLVEERYEEALADYDTVIELAPDYSQAYVGRAIANISLGDNEAALADYDRLIDLEPENTGAYASRAILYIQESNYDAALIDLNEAIRLQPNDPSLYLQRGSVHSALDHPAEAASDYLEWIRRRETDRVEGNRLQPGESQVLPMESGLTYYLPFRAAAGQTATLTASARPDTDTDPLIVLLDTEGNPVAADDDGGGDFNAAITDYVIPADGLYLLVVSHAGGNPDGLLRVLLEFK